MAAVDERGHRRRHGGLTAALATIALLGAAVPAEAADLPALSVQAVAPTGDGRARVAECSGALIAPDLVLTAGHCLDGIAGPSQVAVFAYDGNRPRPTPLRVAVFARHPDHVVGWRERPGDPSQRQAEIAADLAILRLQTPVAGVAPLALAADPAAASTKPSAFAGTGAPGAGRRSGSPKRAALTGVRLSSGAGSVVAFASSGATVCGGDSGAPAASASAGEAPEIWGVVAAVIRGESGCGSRIVIAPASADSPALARMRAEVGAR